MLGSVRPARTFISIKPAIGGKYGYWAISFHLPIRSGMMRGELEGFFDAIERWRDVFGPGYVDEDLETFRDLCWSLARFVMGGCDIEYTRL
jgi:hypothetical protein